jgi:hypothetical protein
VIVHVPAATVVTVESPTVTVHTDGVSGLNNTGRPGGDADAVRGTGVPTVTSGGWSKVMVGAAGVVATALTWVVSQVFCTFADGLVSRSTPPAHLVGLPTTAARRQIPRNPPQPGSAPGKTRGNLSA